MFGFIIGCGAGGAAVWYGKDKLQVWFLGAEALAANLQAKAAALTPTPPPPPTPPKV